ncbi:hypothetical protein K461DRAFT_283114 [Myriangium duriaei CBS 260.36]|uniref:2EXR domain-containing protein n=1 Tax=Myriangium duriaei CBS 260.36 TaxID=1168546 RepID=A0A9P4MCB3_9PEZI|nr:hypothetical protein K461DRAFT_283114 [Myriangium duriaei CBS 260.36]
MTLVMSSLQPPARRHPALHLGRHISNLRRLLPQRRTASTATTPSSMLTTFHLFPLLPPEIRAQIWTLSLPAITPSLTLYDRTCWTRTNLLSSSLSTTSDTDSDSEPFPLWRMHYDHSLLPATCISVPPAFVNREAHAIAASWLAETRVRYGTASGFYCPFDPAYDALYVPLAKWRQFRKAYTRWLGWGKMMRWPTWEEVRRRRWRLPVTVRSEIRTVAVDRRVVEKYGADRVLDVLEDKWEVWWHYRGGVEKVLVVEGREQGNGDGEGWTWWDVPPGGRLEWNEERETWTVVGLGVNEIARTWFAPPMRRQWAPESLREVQSVVAVRR